MTQQDLARVQEIGKELLFHVADICEKNNIEYFLFYGTLIGAIRHGGYIPWDDDIDIAMTKDNYLRFIEVAKHELSSKYHIVIMGSGSPKYVSEIKIGVKGTRFCLKKASNLGIMNEIQLDIFCLDSIRPMSITKIKALNMINKVIRFSKLNWEEKKLLMLCAENKSFIVKYLSQFILLILHMIRFLITEKGLEWFLFKQYVDTTNRSPYMNTLSVDVKHLYNREDLKPIKHIYEGKLLSIPSGYDNILKAEYGDYMIIPPIGRRNEAYHEQCIFLETKDILKHE